VKQQIGTISNQKVPLRFARTLHQHTEGNPFFVEEILRLLIEEGVIYHDGGRWTARSTPEEMPIPGGAREILFRRLAHVSDDCRDILSLASVIGRKFELESLIHLSTETIERTCELLDEAVGARVIERLRGPVRDYVFCQAMVRDLLYESLPTLTRAGLHGRFAEHMETIHEADLDHHASSLAHHFLRTADPEALAKAHEYALRAATRAAALMAHEEAARHYETALQALPSLSNGNMAKRFETLLKAAASWWRAADGGRARRVALEATEIARSRGDTVDSARAALAYAGQLPGFGAIVCDPTVVHLLEEALVGLADTESGLQALLMGRLAEEITFSDERERRSLLGKQAVEVARRSGDPSVLASVLKNRQWALWTPENVEGRLEQADEVIRLAGATHDKSMAFEGHLFRCLAKLELAAMPAVQEEMAACSRIAYELRQPYSLWLVTVARACIAFSQGRLHQIEDLAHQALELGEQAQNPNAALFHDVQLAHLYWLRGQFAELAQIAQKIGSEYPRLNSALQCALAAIFSEQGLTDMAREQFESLAVDDFKRLPRDVTWAMSLTLLAVACAFLGDTKRASRLYELLRPFEHRVVVLAPVVPWGPSCHYLGLLAATMGDAGLARRHYDDALAMSTRLGMAQWLARTQLAYAELLLSQPDATERAQTLLEQSAVDDAPGRK
jgi:tetratricopeptide (TPR) repeat protein